MKQTTKYGRGNSQWIDSANLKFLRIKKFGYVGGCILIAYVITTDGKKYFIIK